jgi:aminoglycoside phosphotransferase (APT) family kinase protein
MTLLREALEASLADSQFVREQLLPALPLAGTMRDPSLSSPWTADQEDGDEVTAELTSIGTERLLLTAYGEDDQAEHEERMLGALRRVGFAEPSRYRVPRPVVCMPDWRLVLTARAPGVSVAGMVERRSPAAAAAVKEAGRWLARLHRADLRIGSPWLQWRSLSGLAKYLKQISKRPCANRLDLRRMLHALAPLAARARTETWVQTHGRFRADRAIVGLGGATVHDFVWSAPGDPARDVAEFVFNLRLRAARSGDARMDVLPSAFLDGYLADFPQATLSNLPFYSACTVLTSLARLLAGDSPSEEGSRETVEFHLGEFHRHVASRALRLKAPA